jgi:putative FmdB family regulatory protein
VPTYQYVCTECGGQLEVVQKFTDDTLTVHEECGGRLRKVFSPVGIVFKGSGFYKTDSRNSASPGSSVPVGAGAKSDSSGESSSSDSKSSDAKSSESKSGGDSASSSPASSSSSSGDKSSSSSGEKKAAKSSGEKVA